MTRSSLRERLERLGPVQDIVRVSSGSSEDFLLSALPGRERIDVIAASMSIARRGVSLLKAKRTIESMLQDGQAYVHLPTVEDAAAITDELCTAGVTASRKTAPKTIDVAAIRKSLDLTQEQFALRFGLELDTLRRWEAGRSTPDKAARSYLTLIRKEPDTIQRIADLA
jgi:DNA-binding transcriptional regulator YiaG